MKQVGYRPLPRSGLSSVAIVGSNKVMMFGGVQDKLGDEESDSDDENGPSGTFYNELYSVHVENERATWQLGT